MDSFHARNHKAKPEKPERVTPVRAGTRIDQWLVDHGLAPSRSAAQRLVEAGRVGWRSERGEHRVTKPSELVPADAQVRVEQAG